MNYANNWQRGITLAAGALTCPLDLPDGQYRLTLTDSATAPAAWEIVIATVASGTATLQRAQEGTSDQLWPAGSVIYQAVTAGTLADIHAQLASLDARVTALEGGGGDEPTHVLVAQDHPTNTSVGYQWPSYNDFGTLTPDVINVAGQERTITALTTEPTMIGQQIALELDGVVTSDLRIKIEGVMPSGVEWITLPISGLEDIVHYVEFMGPLVDGQTYNIWLEEI